MKKVLLLCAFLMFTTLCVRAEYLMGFIYNGATTPGGGYSATPATKQGTSICRNIFFIASVGDCSVRAAMKNGGIKTLGGYDVQRRNILGFQVIRTKAWGN